MLQERFRVSIKSSYRAFAGKEAVFNRYIFLKNAYLGSNKPYLEEKTMLEKKFAQFLLLLVVLLGFSATGAMGANILFVSSMDTDHMPGDDAIKAFFEGLL